MTPGSYDIALTRGNTFSRLFRFKADDVAMDLDGSTFVLRIIKGSTQLYRFVTPSSALSITDADEGELTLSLTAAQTRALPEGKIARYELERRVSGGEEQTYLAGYINATGGVNDDA